MTADQPRPSADLSGKVAVVTGAAGTIGHATAVRLAEAGATVVVTDVTQHRLAAVVQELEGLTGSSVLAVTADVSNLSAVRALGERVADRYGGADIWANVAGHLVFGTTLEATPETLAQLFGTNYAGTLWGCQTAADLMVGRSGSIINVTSGAADQPSPHNVLYGCSKAAAAHLTRSFAVQAGPMGIRVNAVAPGYVESGMTSARWRRPDGSIDPDAREAALDNAAKRSPLGTIGTGRDIAECVLFLASDASRFMTGQTLRPNGGVVIL